MTLLSAALDYRRRGFSIIPIAAAKKPPAGFSWKPFQKQVTPEDTLTRWLSRDNVTGLAVVLGPVSGGLYCRDFDTAGAYPAWAAQNADLAKRLPTVATHRGAHVYFRSEHETRTQTLGDGELRGAGGYCLLPPSLHPEGPRYEWRIPLPAGHVPIENPALFIHCTEKTEMYRDGTEMDRATEENGSGLYLPQNENSKFATIADAVSCSVPTQRGQSHKVLFVLARALLTFEHARSSCLSDIELNQAFAQWYDRAKPFLRSEQSRDMYYFEFLEAKKRARIPLGGGIVREAFQRATALSPPECAMQFDSTEVRLLVTFCRELQRVHKSEPFFLSCRTLATLLNHENHSTANFYLRGIENAGIIRTIEKGSAATNRATRFKYLHPLDR